MDWQGIVTFVAVWTAASFPFGVLLGRIMRGIEEVEVESRAIPMLPAPALQLPASWLVARETSPALGKGSLVTF